jgi:hypothetical protein
VPSPRFLKDMGVASIVAGVIMLGLSHAVSKVPPVTAAVIALLAAVAAGNLAALFTDAQWHDVVNSLNFLVLVYLTYQGHRINPQKSANKTMQELEEHTPDLSMTLAEHLVDELERRRRTGPENRRRKGE